MRLISQTGDIDIPYENASLSRAENIIRAYVPMIGEKGTIMAQYLTEEKAKKVMKALHKVYAGMFLAQNVEMSDDDCEECIKMAARGFGIIKTMVNSPDMKFEPANIVFRFPEDDEV
jgi:HEPN domain-containing protein